MEGVLQIVGSIVLLVVGVGVILYVLFRKSPVKSEDQADVEDAEDAEDAEGETEEAVEPGDDIPEGDAPEEIEREEKK